MARLLRKLLGEESGAAAVEAAVTLPVLLLLGSGVFEFSNAFFDHQEITTGIRDAARYFARLPVPNQGNNPCVVNDQTFAKNLAVYGDINGGTKPRVPGWTVGAVTITCPEVDNPSGGVTYRGAAKLYFVRAATSFPYQQIGLLNAFGLGSPTFTVAHSERWIGD